MAYYNLLFSSVHIYGESDFSRTMRSNSEKYVYDHFNVLTQLRFTVRDLWIIL